ncbi:MAG: UDP-N-acetylmuramate--L-alanine ligase [Clostridia bacterium]|nr:UDP-N-acetylmuramate--L-alanine ligase [Clostridia bacterium]
MKEIDKLLDSVKRIHFIGIGGSGMCPLAEILHEKGYILSGSDNNESNILKRIRALGIPVVLGQKAENIGDAELVIYTAALLPDNPELVAAKESGIPTFERSVLFGAVTRKFNRCVGVCGTHGKTTTTSMLTQMLMHAGEDPSAVIGGKLPLIDAYGRIGKTDLIVCESCEFANHFLELSPSCVLILNVDADHLEFFKTIDNLINSFSKFADLASDCVIYNGDDEKSRRAVSGMQTKKELITFGLDKGNDWYAENVHFEHGAFAVFDVYKKGELIGTAHLSVPGDHNVYNALGAIAAADYVGADLQKSMEGMGQFHGAGRRFEELGNVNGITVIDDYAHHPAELLVTIESAMKMDYNRVWAVFQPFTFSRTYMLLDDFAKVLSLADRVVLTDIMGSREVNTWDIHTKDLADKIPGCVWFESADKTSNFAEIAQYICDNAQSGDLILTLGCGDVYKIAEQLLDKLQEKYN